MIPATLNGHPVRGALPRPRSDADAMLVLVERDHPYHPWVVASWHPVFADTWAWGHYFATYDEALAYLTERAMGATALVAHA